MTDSKIQRIEFHARAIEGWAAEDKARTNWPVVYTLNDDKEIYVGETTNAELRMKQHLQNTTKSH